MFLKALGGCGLLLVVAVCGAVGTGVSPTQWQGLTERPTVTELGWCGTQEVWEAKGIEGFLGPAGDCPIQGDCDVPGIRDFHQVYPFTLFKTIRVHVHVFREDDGSNPAATEEEILEQMAEFQADYAPWRIRFDWTWGFVDDTTYRYGQNVSQMKQVYAISPATTCNVYVVDLGYAFGTFPWDPDCLTADGGIVITEEFVPELHHALTHEMGHCLGLWHTHHGVSEVAFCGDCYEIPWPPSSVTGDFCADTPPTPVDYDCESQPGNDSCSGEPWGDTDQENYMSYGGFDPGCWSLYTPQQAARMHCWITDVLSSWLTCDSTEDCNGNYIPDDCDIAEGTSADDDGNGVPDECENALLGDLNCDEQVDFDDINPFVLALSGQAAYEAVWPDCAWLLADCDQNGDVDFDDINAFVALMGS